MRIRPNKTKIIVTVIVAILLILFLPIPKGSLDDGGTRVYAARLYKIVAWNRVVEVEDSDGISFSTQYRKTSVYWFGKGQKSIDELWEIEFENNRAELFQS